MSDTVPVGWMLVKLDEIVDVLDFEREPINSSERSGRIAGKKTSDLYPYYGATGQVGWIDNFRSKGQRVLLGEDGAPFLDSNKDKAYLVNGHFWVNNHAHILKGADGYFDNLFLCHQLNTVDYQPFVSGSTRLKLTSSAMKQIPLLVAPKNEQTRIVEKLEELLTDLDTATTELKTAQKKLTQYRQSLLKAAVEGALTAEWRANNTPSESGGQLLARILKERRARWEQKQLEKFKEQGKIPPKDWQSKYSEPVKPNTTGLMELPEGWVWASMAQLCEIQGGIQKQPSRTPVLNKYPFLRVANVARSYLKLDEIHEVELFEGELERLALQKGDVLIVEGNGSLTEIGRCALWDDSIKNAVHQNHLIRARPVLMVSEFMETWLNSFRGIEQMTTLAATTSGLYTLSVGKISKIPVPVPPVSEQMQIYELLNVTIAEQIRQSAAIEISLKQSAAQRKNILKAAFSGQLVPQDPNDEPASVLLERINESKKAEGTKKKGKAQNPSFSLPTSSLKKEAI